MWRQLVQPATDDGRSSLSQGGVAGVGGDGQVLIWLWVEGVNGQGEAAQGGRSFSHGAVTLRVSGLKSLRQTLGPGELVAPEGANRTNEMSDTIHPVWAFILKSVDTCI